MTFGLDDYGRYVEIDGERFVVEPFPYWGWNPMYLWMHVWKRIEIGVWHMSRVTGIAWAT